MYTGRASWSAATTMVCTRRDQEAKEGVVGLRIRPGSYTLQNYFRLYPEGSRSGMTGHCETEAAEFASTYKIGVIRFDEPSDDS